MMKEMSKMAKMNTKDRNALLHIQVYFVLCSYTFQNHFILIFFFMQEGLSGSKPMNAEWIDATVQALVSNPDLFKGMFKGRGAALGRCIFN